MPWAALPSPRGQPPGRLGQALRLVDQTLDPFFIAQVRDRRCVLFAGAGLSAAAGFPSWAQLLQGVAASARQQLPDLKTAGLDALVAEGKLLEAAAYLRDTMGAAGFHAALGEQLQKKDVAPSALHQLIARFQFRAIVTTNFDPLIERAFGGALPVATQVDAKDLARYLAEDRPFVFKVHGDIARPETIILTSEEFARATVDNKAFKTAFNALLLTSPLLFVGYSHSDPDFDLFLRENVQVFGHEGARRYALMRALDEKDTILQGLLKEKSVTVLPYQQHDEVPAFFERLLQTTQAPAGKVTRRPPRAALPGGLKNDRVVTMRTSAARARPGARLAVVIPGLMGSQLAVREPAGEEKSIWLNPVRLLMGAMAELDLAAPKPRRVSAPKMLAQFSEPLVNALAASREVLPFPYDWRLDYRENAARLAEFLERECAKGTHCDLVAINEGGLLARAFLADYRGDWRRLHGERGGRVVLLGTANHGTFQSVLMLLGEHSLVKALGMLDLKHKREDIRRIFASFPSLYQMLPSPRLNAAWRALYERKSWGACEVSAEFLADGLKFHEEIAEAIDADRMVAVLGDGQPTVVSVDDPERLDRQPQWAMTSEGDGTVAHSDARLEKAGRAVPTYYAPVEHSALGTDGNVARAVVEILERGMTTLLASGPKAAP